MVGASFGFGKGEGEAPLFAPGEKEGGEGDVRCSFGSNLGNAREEVCPPIIILLAHMLNLAAGEEEKGWVSPYPRVGYGTPFFPTNEPLLSFLF